MASECMLCDEAWPCLSLDSLPCEVDGVRGGEWGRDWAGEVCEDGTLDLEPDEGDGACGEAGQRARSHDRRRRVHELENPGERRARRRSAGGACSGAVISAY